MRDVGKMSRAKPSNMMVYKNLLLSLVAVEEKIIAAVMNLDGKISLCLVNVKIRV